MLATKQLRLLCGGDEAERQLGEKSKRNNTMKRNTYIALCAVVPIVCFFGTLGILILASVAFRGTAATTPETAVGEPVIGDNEVIAFNSASKPGDPPSDKKDRGYAHQVVPKAKEVVRASLKYPLDAKFPWFGVTVEKDGWYSFCVKSHVKAKNGFGNYVTVPYSCTFRYDGKGRWDLMSLKIDSDECLKD